MRNGKWQHCILNALETSPNGKVFISDLLPQNYNVNTYTSLYRSARTLAKRGKIQLQPMQRENHSHLQLCAIQRF